MRLGIFGGTFDPPHVGHVLVATDALERLALDRLLIVPAATQPLKAGTTRTDAALRLAMARAAFGAGDDPRFEVDPIEIDRGGLSYTVDTLGTLADRWPGAERFLLAGADVLATLRHWHQPLRVRELATLVVLTRVEGGEDGRVPTAAPPDFPGGPPLFLPTRRVDVSSTEVRARVAAGRSIRGFVPDRVADVIESAGLYR